MTQYIKAAARPVTNQVKFVTNRVKLVTNQKRDQERMTCVKKIKSGENKKATDQGRTGGPKILLSHLSTLIFCSRYAVHEPHLVPRSHSVLHRDLVSR